MVRRALGQGNDINAQMQPEAMPAARGDPAVRPDPARISPRVRSGHARKSLAIPAGAAFALAEPGYRSDAYSRSSSIRSIAHR